MLSITLFLTLSPTLPFPLIPKGQIISYGKFLKGRFPSSHKANKKDREEQYFKEVE